jgi:hypothetical protein
MAIQKDNIDDQAAAVSPETAHRELDTLLNDVRAAARLLCGAATSEELELADNTLVQISDRIERDVDRCAELSGKLLGAGATPHDVAKREAVDDVDEGAVNGAARSVSHETASDVNQQALGLLFEIAAVGDLLSLAAGIEKGTVEICSGTLLEAGSGIQEKAQKVVELVEELHLRVVRSRRPAVIEPAAHPADDDGSADDDILKPLQDVGRPEGTGGLEDEQWQLLVGDGIRDITSGILGIADTLAGPLYEDIESETAQRIVDALQQLARRLYDCADVPGVLRDKVQNALEAPDSRVEKMAKRLREKGLCLWMDPTRANCYGVSDRNYRGMEMAILSLDEIDSNLHARSLRPLASPGEGGAA